MNIDHYERELGEILHTAKVNWQTSPDEIFDKGVTAYAKQAILALHKQAVVAELEALEDQWQTKENYGEPVDVFHGTVLDRLAELKARQEPTNG